MVRRFLLVLWALFCAGPAMSAGPVETSVFSVQGVAVDVIDTDATTAKNKALVQVQIKALAELSDRLANPSVTAELAQLPEKDVVRLLKSLSIEEESAAPGRYIGKFTVRFQPSKMRTLFAKYGVSVSEDQAKPLLVIPVWKAAAGPQLWEDNPWRKAWIDLHAERSTVPIIIPLGDLEDSGTLTAAEALAADPAKLDAFKKRYDVRTVLISTGEAAEGGGVHATLVGDSPLGRIYFDKTYTAEDANEASSAKLAIEKFHAVMTDKYRRDRAKAVAAAEAERQAQVSHALPVAVPFSGPSEWNGIRSRMLKTPGVIGVDVSTLDGSGAVVQLLYTGSIEAVQQALQSAGLSMTQVGGSWVIQQL